MRKKTKGRNIQHIKLNDKKGKPGRSVKHKPKVDPVTSNLWGLK